MPRQVNHDERRSHIAQALWRVVEAGGVPAVSFRTVAAEAGVSVSLVQHYFGSRRDLLVWCVNHQTDTLGAAIVAALGHLGPDPTPRQSLEVVTANLLPLDDERRRTMLVYHSFAAAAVTDRSLLTPRIQERGQGLVDAIAGLIAGASPTPGTQPEVEARGLVGMILGLSLGMLMGQMTAGEALGAVHLHLDRLC